MINSFIDAPTIYRHMVNCRLWVRLDLKIMTQVSYEWQRCGPKKVLSGPSINKLSFPIKFTRRVSGFTGIFEAHSTVSSIDEKYWHMSSFVICPETNDPNVVYDLKLQMRTIYAVK